MVSERLDYLTQVSACTVPDIIIIVIVVSQANPHLGVGPKTLYCRAWLCFVVSRYICIHVSAVHSYTVSTRKTFSTLLKIRNGRHGRLDSVMMKKTAADLKTKGRKLDPHMTCMLIAVRERMLEFYSD